MTSGSKAAARAGSKRRPGWMRAMDAVGSSPASGVLAVVGLVVSVAVLVGITSLDLPRRGLLDLTFAGQAGVARDVVFRLSRAGMRDDARQAVALDWWLIVAYVVGGVAACLWGGVRLLGDRAEVRRAAAIGVVVAGALDVIENFGLSAMLSGRYRTWPLVTEAAAWPKFFILAAVLPYAVIALTYRVYTNVAAANLRRGSRPALRSPALIAQTAPSVIQELPPPQEVGAVPSWREQDWVPTPGRIGISCSGGGVRSASFNLGALQALTEHGAVRHARYLAAVSGGAYIASALVSIQRETQPPHRPSLHERGGAAFAPGTPEVAYLRRNTSYLAPSGLSKLILVVRLMGGLAINVGLGLLVLFIVSRPLGWLLRIPTVHGDLCDRGPAPTPALVCGEIGRLHVPNALWVAVLWPAAIGLVIGLFAIARRWGSLRRYHVAIGIAAALASLSIAMFTALILLPWIGITLPKITRSFVEWLPKVQPTGGATANYVWLANLLGIGALGAAIARIVTRRSARIATVVAAILFPATVIVAASLMIVGAARSGVRGPFFLFGERVGIQGWWWIGAIALFAIVYAWGDQTAWSMHPFYKRRLCIAFSLRRTGRDAVEEVPYDTFQALSRYDFREDCREPGHRCDETRPHTCGDEACVHECRPIPEIVVCAAANVTERGGAPTGRAALPFTFGPHEIGGRDVGWIKTTDMEASLVRRRVRDITLPAAVAISGAAVSPAMGKMSRPAVRALLTLTNARLGVWLPNPRFVSQLRSVGDEIPGGQLLFRDRARPNYLAKEAFGLHRKGDRFLYVTDGGHVENLGVVELLRRGCTEIFCFDASGDQVDTFFTLGEAVAIARSELGVEIRLDPTPLRELDTDHQPPRGQPWSTRDVQVGTFSYPPDVSGTRVEGRIVYTKAVVTPAATWDVKAYGEKDETFPTLGTVSQLFSEERFDAYRGLGYGAGHRAAIAADIAREASLP